MAHAFYWEERHDHLFQGGPGYWADCCGRRIVVGQFILEGNDWSYRHTNPEDCNRGEPDARPPGEENAGPASPDALGTGGSDGATRPVS